MGRKTMAASYTDSELREIANDIEHPDYAIARTLLKSRERELGEN